MLKQISILSAIAITLAAVAPGAEAGSMKRTWKSWAATPTPPTPVVVTPPAPARTVIQKSEINNTNAQENVVVGTASGKKGCNTCGTTGITAGIQGNKNDVTQAISGGGNVTQSSLVNNTNSQLNMVVGNGSIKAGDQSNTNVVKQTVSP